MSEKKTLNPQISLGDLLRALDGLGDTDAITRRAVAAMLGFEWAEETVKKTDMAPDKVSTIADEMANHFPRQPIAESQEKVVDISQKPPPADLATADATDEAWVEALPSTSSQMPDWYYTVTALPFSAGSTVSARPPIDSLFQPRWIRALLQNALAVIDDRGHMDIERTVERLARAKPLLRFPRLKRMRLGGAAQILIDMSEAMRPYAEDQYAILDDIKRLIATEMVEEMIFKGCPSRGAGRRGDWPMPAYCPPHQGTTVLLLTDLGVGSNSISSERIMPAEWLSFADTVRKAGCELVALVPYPITRISPMIRRAFAVIPWDRTTTTGIAQRIRRDADRRSGQ